MTVTKEIQGSKLCALFQFNIVLDMVVSHAVGQGTVIWVFISEVFPQKFRAEGQSFGSFTHWMFCATLTFVFPLMTAKMPTWSIFALFGTFMAFHIFWAIFFVPETRGKVLEEIKL